jgi:hypothetical protein
MPCNMCIVPRLCGAEYVKAANQHSALRACDHVSRAVAQMNVVILQAAPADSCCSAVLFAQVDA